MALADGAGLGRAQLVIHTEVSALQQCREGLAAVVLKVSALVVDALDEQMVCVGRRPEKLLQGFVGEGRDRIPVVREFVGNQIPCGDLEVVVRRIVGACAHDVGLSLVTAAGAAVGAVLRALEVDHPHPDAVLVVIYGFNR